MAAHAAIPGCPACDGQRTISFNWQIALEKSGLEIDKYPKYLRRERPLKFGFLYVCTVCRAQWFLDDREEMMSVIPSDRVKLTEDWNHRELLPSPEILAIAKLIRATPPDLYGNGSQFVQVPCAALTKSGERYDMALLAHRALACRRAGAADLPEMERAARVK